MTTIARGDIEVNLNDAAVIAGLRAVDAQFDRTMRKIEHSRAEAEIDADLKPLDRKLAQAKARLKEFQAGKAHAAVIGADTSQFDRKMLVVNATIKRLEAQRARVKIDVDGEREALNALRRVTQAQEDADRAARKRLVTVRQEAADVARLQQQYARLTDRLERITKQRPIGREARAKVELDAASTILQMEALKAKLNALGAHPPVDIKADIDRGAARRVLEFLSNIGNRAAKLSDLTVRLGPFTTSIKGLITALGFLGPTITDVLGAAGALVGTLGAGVSGAAVLGTGALIGFGQAALGLVFATRNTRQELQQARTSINAYQNAVLKYGASSDKAKTKQQEMNSVLRQISPLAREAALGTERFFRQWDKGTKPTQGNLGRIAKAGFQALLDLEPQWMRQTNQMSKILADNLTKGFKFLGRGPGKEALASIGRDFNAALPALLHGLGAFGHGLLNAAVEGAHALSMLTGGIDNLGQKFLAFTQSDNFGATVRGWIMQARDLMRFFGALTRVAVHFFGAGSKAGQSMVQNMTNALNRWDAFLTSVSGRNKVANAFDRAAKGATALWHALAPLVGSFVMWANNLSPFVTGVLQGISGVSRLVAKVTELVGLGGPLAALGATLGAMWAVGKIGAFVSVLARIPGIIRDIAAAGSLKGALSALGGMSLKTVGGAGSIEAGGRIAAAEIQAAMATGGAEAAAEIRAAMIAGGAVAAGEEAAGEAVGGAAVAGGLAGMAGGSAAVGAEAAGAGAAVGGLTLATGGLIVVAAAATIGLGILASKLGHGKTQVEKLSEAIHNQEGFISADNAVIRGQAKEQDEANARRRAAIKTLADLRKELANAQPGTIRYRELQLQIYDAEKKRNTGEKEAIQSARESRRAAKDEISDLQKQKDLIQQRTKARVEDAKHTAVGVAGRGGGISFIKDQAAAEHAAAQGAAEVAEVQRRIIAAMNARAAATLNVARAQHGLDALTGRAAQQAGLLARTRPGLAQNIATKFQSPQNVGDVSAAARRALGQGVKIKTVLQVIADSKNAEAALRRLRSLELKKKLLHLGITGDDGVLSKLSAIDRKAIREKIARIIQHGGEPTLSMINRIINRQIRDKSFAVRASVAQALGAIQAVQNLMASIHDKTVAVNIVQHAVSLGNKKASGRGPAGSERALIGEGRAPEHYIDPERGLAFKTQGPMIADLSPSAFVIPTEVAYRARGRDLLKEAADDLGLSMYKKGKGKKKYKKLPIMHDGSITTDFFSSRQQSTRDEYNKYATKTNSLEDQLEKARKSKSRAKTPSAKSNAQHRINDLQKELQGRPQHAKELRRLANKATDRYNRYATDQNLIEQFTSEMNLAATNYNQTGRPEFLSAWNTAKDSRSKAYADLVALIQAVDDKTGQGSKWKSELNKLLSGAKSDEATADADEAPVMDLETFIKSLGKTEELTGLNTALSLAGTTQGIGDDTTAAQNLVNFYSGLLGAAQGTGNQSLIGQVADALSSAQGTLTGLQGQGTTSDQEAINAQLQQRLTNAQRTAAAANAFIETSLGPGDIGTGTALGAARGGNVININTLHPGDPATLRAIGDAATSGMGYQPSRSSTILNTGM